MKFADRLKFTASGANAATITFGAAVAGCRTLAQVVNDGDLLVGDTGVPFYVDDGAGNWELGLFTVTSATVLTRTSTLRSSAGGTTAATFTGASLAVFNAVPASQSSKVVTATGSGASATLYGSDGVAIPLSASPASSSTVPPSGDVTGATDAAAINAALNASSRVVLQAGAQYYVNAPIVLGSNSHLSAYGAKITLVTGVTGNILRNKAALPSRTILDATVIGAGISGNATFTTSNTFGTAATGQIGDMVGIFGAGQATTNGATPSAWYGAITAITTPTSGTTWANAKAAATTILAGTVVRPATSNGFIFQATTGGAPGVSEPTWGATAGQTTTDGGVTWTCMPAGATAVTLSCTAQVNVTNATANVYFASDRNDNINITGGSWTCVDSFRHGHDPLATVSNSFATQFRRLSNLRIRDVTFATNVGTGGSNTTPYSNQNGGGRFTISVSDFQNVSIDGVTLNGTSGDGVHLTGPGDSALVTNVKGFNVGDDCVVTNLEDNGTPYIMDTEGSLSNITVRDVVNRAGKSRTFCHYDSGNANRFSSTPVRWIMRNLHIEKISGDSLGALVSVFQVAQGLVIREVFGQTNTAVNANANNTVANANGAYNPLVNIGADQGPWTGMTIEDVTWMGSLVAQNGVVRIDSPRGVVNVKNLRFGTATDGVTTDYPNVGLYLTGNIQGSGYGPTAVTIDGFASNGPANGGANYGSKAYLPGDYQASPQYAHSLMINGATGANGLGIQINMRNIMNTALQGYLYYKASNVNVSCLSISDSFLSSTAAANAGVVNVPSGDTAGTYVFNNVRTNSPLITAQSNVTVGIINCVFSSSRTLIQMTGANSASCDISVSQCRQYGSGALFSRDGTQTIRVRGTSVPVDQTLVANPGDGDMIYNNNATPANGTGVAMWNTAAAKWKNLYSGLTN